MMKDMSDILNLHKMISDFFETFKWETPTENMMIKIWLLRVSKNFDMSSEGNLDRNSPDIMLWWSDLYWLGRIQKNNSINPF